MSTFDFIERRVVRSPMGATCLYVCLVLTFLSATWMSVFGVLERTSAISAATDILNQLEGRSSARRANSTGPGISGMNGSPFLEGATVTVAGAALLQRVGSAVAAVGGSTLSSQVELQGSQAKAGFIAIIVSCEVAQPQLQKLIYDLEAGMPFLFIDQLVVQSPISATNTSEQKLRVLLEISGQWQGSK